jgi:hypothetical protein
MTTATITLPRSTVNTLYRQIGRMKKDREELDHMMATLDELTGNISHTTNTKTLAHELGYSIH